MAVAVLLGLGLVAGGAALQLIPGCADTNYFNDAGGTPVDGGPVVDIDVKGVKSLRIVPEDAVLAIVNDKPVEQAYQALGKFADGSERDVTAATEFNVNDPWVGLFKGNVFTSASVRGGKTTLTAQIGPVGASTSVTVVYRRVFFGQDIPTDTDQKFDKASSDSGRAPSLVYPPDGVLIPPNLLEMEFQWTAGLGNDLFEVALQNDGTDVRFYTKCNPVGSGCGFIPDEASWKVLVTTFKGQDAAKVTVRGTDSATLGAVGVSETRSMAVAEEDILGGLYYWNASSGNIIRYDFGKANQKAKIFLTAAEAKAAVCVGCHALSRDGKRMAVGLDMPVGFPPLKVIDVASKDLLATGSGNFMTFSPDGETIITSDGNSMVYQEAATMKPIPPTPLVAKGTMPDWSPDGTRIVFSEPGGFILPGIGVPGINQGSLKMMLYDKNTNAFSAPTMLVPSANKDNKYYPTFSPDSNWIVFNQAQGESYDAPDARLWILRADGKGQPMELKLANGEGDLGNSWPKFSPFVQKYRGGKLMWVTFSSRRDYGLRKVGMKSGESKPRAQLWMAAIDPAKAEMVDPSHGAFWLPFQDIDTGNHIGQWSETVVRKPCEQGTCPSGEFCDENGFCEPNAPD
jgi:hypothetical protein